MTTARKPGGPRRSKTKPKEIKVLSAKDVGELLDGGLDGNLLEDEQFMADRGWELDPEIKRRLSDLRQTNAEKAKKFDPLKKLILAGMAQLGREPSIARVLQKIGYAPKRKSWMDDKSKPIEWHGPGPTYTEPEILECFNLMIRAGELAKGTRDPDQGICLPHNHKTAIANRLLEHEGRTGAVMVTEEPTLGEKAQRISTRAVCVADRPEGVQHFCSGVKKNGSPCTAKVPVAGGRCFHHPLEAKP